MENFSIESANKVISVNGVELNLNFDDSNFMKNITSLGEEINTFINNKNLDTTSLSKKIDDLFGENTCMNVFKCNAPSSILLFQFFEYISKFVEDYSKNYVAKINEKYNPERSGESDV